METETQAKYAGKTVCCTAWALLGELYALVDTTHEIRLPGGRVAYHAASTARGDRSVRLSRLVTHPELRQTDRYVPADQPVELVPIEK